MEGTKYCYKNVNIDLNDLCRDIKPNSRGEYIIPTCPVCSEELGIIENYKLYIKSDKSCGYCQRCKSKFFNEVKPEKSYLDEYKIPNFEFKTINYSLEKVDCSYYLKSKDYDKDGVNYLTNRNYKLRDLYKDLKFKFRINKVIMPCIWDDEIIYYQVRNLETNKSLRSFFLPPSDYKPIWLNPLNSKENDTLCICEGIFGAIGAWLNFNGKINTCSCFGSNITDYQIWMLNQKCFDKLYLYFDDITLNKANYNKLIKSNLKPVTYYSIKSEYGDPEDDYNNEVNLNIMKYF